VWGPLYEGTCWLAPCCAKDVVAATPTAVRRSSRGGSFAERELALIV